LFILQKIIKTRTAFETTLNSVIVTITNLFEQLFPLLVTACMNFLNTQFECSASSSLDNVFTGSTTDASFSLSELRICPSD